MSRSNTLAFFLDIVVLSLSTHDHVQIEQTYHATRNVNFACKTLGVAKNWM